MNLSKKIASAFVAGSMIATPIVAEAAVADVARTGATVEGEQQAAGFPFLIVLAVIAVGVGLYFVIDGGDDEPASP